MSGSNVKRKRVNGNKPVQLELHIAKKIVDAYERTGQLPFDITVKKLNNWEKLFNKHDMDGYSFEIREIKNDIIAYAESEFDDVCKSLLTNSNRFYVRSFMSDSPEGSNPVTNMYYDLEYNNNEFKKQLIKKYVKLHKKKLLDAIGTDIVTLSAFIEKWMHDVENPSVKSAVDLRFLFRDILDAFEKM